MILITEIYIIRFAMNYTSSCYNDEITKSRRDVMIIEMEDKAKNKTPK